MARPRPVPLRRPVRRLLTRPQLPARVAQRRRQLPPRHCRHRDPDQRNHRWNHRWNHCWNLRPRPTEPLLGPLLARPPRLLEPPAPPWEPRQRPLELPYRGDRDNDRWTCRHRWLGHYDCWVHRDGRDRDNDCWNCDYDPRSAGGAITTGLTGRLTPPRPTLPRPTYAAKADSDKADAAKADAAKADAAKADSAKADSDKADSGKARQPLRSAMAEVAVARSN